MKDLSRIPATGDTEEDGTFTITARRCKRCGGILTSRKAVAEGYGHVCKMKTLGERQVPGQMSLESMTQERSDHSE